MSNATVLTLQPAVYDCPAWCAQDPQAEATGSHVSAPIRLPAPEGTRSDGGVPLLSVQIGIGHQEAAHGEQPRLWLSSADGTAELDSATLASFIADLDKFALSVCGLRHRYDTVVVGGAPDAIDHFPPATHPLELVAPCPPWCQYREWNEHTPTGRLADHFHATDEHTMELKLQTVGRSKDGPVPESLEIVMEHQAHARLPQVDLTAWSPSGWHHVSLTFDEADELRGKLNEFIAHGREYAQPEAVASLQEVIDYCGVQVIDSTFDAKTFLGHAVGDTKLGGPVWVTVPRDTTGARREDLLTYLLAEIHETPPERTADGTWACQAGHVPGAHTWPAAQAA